MQRYLAAVPSPNHRFQDSHSLRERWAADVHLLCPHCLGLLCFAVRYLKRGGQRVLEPNVNQSLQLEPHAELQCVAHARLQRVGGRPAQRLGTLEIKAQRFTPAEAVSCK